MNLLKETLEKLKEKGKTPEDVYFIQIYSDILKENTFFWWEDFIKLANMEYDNGYGSAEINQTLKIVGKDWWLERGEYDGSEWWAFYAVPIRPAIFTAVSTLAENRLW